MLRIEIPHPDPSPFVLNETVGIISTAYSRAFREKYPAREGALLDVDRLVDFLEISILEEEEDEPEGARILASTQNDPVHGATIIVNKRYRDFFKERPDVYAAAVGHEVGHIALAHLDILAAPPEQTSLLFDVQSRPAVRLHKSTWGWYGLSKAEIENLKAREREAIATMLKAPSISNEAIKTLKELDSHLEPDWMFWQAECFARCLLIPNDLLQAALRKNWNFYSWSSVYDLARAFGVSGTMMGNRLKKIGVIEVVDGKPRPGTQNQQTSLFE